MNFNEIYDEPYGLEMPFMPSEGYVCMQNPPNFTWQKNEKAQSYDIKVCTDRELQLAEYVRENVENNYFNFDWFF